MYDFMAPRFGIENTKNKSIQLHFFLIHSYVLEKCDISAPMFSTLPNCNRMIPFLATRSLVKNKRCQARANSSCPPQQLPCNICSPVSRGNASLQSVSYSSTSKCPRESLQAALTAIPAANPIAINIFNYVSVLQYIGCSAV